MSKIFHELNTLLNEVAAPINEVKVARKSDIPSNQPDELVQARERSDSEFRALGRIYAGIGVISLAAGLATELANSHNTATPSFLVLGVGMIGIGSFVKSRE